MKAAAGLPFFVLTKTLRSKSFRQRYKQTRAERKGPTVHGDKNQIRHIEIIIQKVNYKTKLDEMCGWVNIFGHFMNFKGEFLNNGICV